MRLAMPCEIAISSEQPELHVTNFAREQILLRPQLRELVHTYVVVSHVDANQVARMLRTPVTSQSVSSFFVRR